MTDVACTLANKITSIGIIGDKRHAERLRQVVGFCKRAKVKSIYHPKRKPDHPLGTTNFGELRKCDAIIIAAPNAFHFDYLKKTSTWNKYIFLEKPIASNEEGLRESLKIIRAGKVYVNYNYRVSAIEETINKYENEIGEVISIEIFSGNGLSYKTSEILDWRLTSEESEDVVLRTKAIHWIDYLSYKYGQSDSIKYRKKSFGPSKVIDTAIVEMDWSTGPNARIISSYASPLIFNIKLVGSNGILLMDKKQIIITSPRDTFNEDGLFLKPPSKEFSYPGNYDLYLGSLINSFEYFLQFVENKLPIPSKVIEQSIKTELLINEIVKNSK
ncbi:Gfo/Idh/MocA family oxidoreductase [bacterium]|nr:Gfo/Idh/MocA family oxidoreductase [bacterium]